MTVSNPDKELDYISAGGNKAIRILRPKAYYDPERTAASQLDRDYEEALTSSGFCIVNYAPIPSRGIDRPTAKMYSHIKYEEKHDGKVIVHRFFMVRERNHNVLRAIRYIFCNAVEFYLCRKEKNIDILYCSSTPPTQGLMCVFIKKSISRKAHRTIPFCYNIQDLFPDSLVSTGIAGKKSFLYRIGDKLSDYVYKNADMITVISQAMQTTLLHKGVPAEKITVIPNWIDTERVHSIKKTKNRLFSELGLDPNIHYFVYAGNLGLSQGIGTILQAAKRLAARKEICILLFGNETRLECYRSEIQAKGIQNVRLFPLLPVERAPEVYCLGDASIVSCKKGVGKTGVPSKAWTIMACGRPIVLSFDANTELHDIIVDGECGLFSPAEDADSLAANIEYLADHPEECGQYGKNARTFVEATHAKKTITRELVKSLRELYKK